MKQCITFGRYAAESPHCYNVVFKGRNIKSNEFTAIRLFESWSNSYEKQLWYTKL